MKLAVIKDGPLLPVKDGASYKIHNLALEYQNNGFEVFFILIDRGWVTESAIMNSGIKNFILISPDSVYDSNNITLLLEKLNIDCIQTNIPELILSKSAEWSSFHVVFDSHDVLYEQSVQKGCSQEMINLEKFIDYAAGTVADTIFCCSERDKELYKELGIKEEKIFVVRNGTRINFEKSLERDGSVVFIGHLFYEPNYEAVLNLFLIAKKLPNIQFKVIGNYPQELEFNKPENVSLLGYVEKIEPILKKSSVAIAPIDHGSGSRIKILDYLATGLQVISSNIGASGLEDLHRFIIIEDDYGKYPSLILENLFSSSDPSYFEYMEKYRFEYIGKYASKILLERFSL